MLVIDVPAKVVLSIIRAATRTFVFFALIVDTTDMSVFVTHPGKAPAAVRTRNIFAMPLRMYAS